LRKSRRIPTGRPSPTAKGTPLALGSDGEQLLYDTTELEVSSGELVTLTFQNNSTAVQHNWVLVDGGTAIADEINALALEVSADLRDASQALPPPDTAGLLVSSPMLDPGGSITFSFNAPTEPGTYLYLCTFPAHYQAGMFGELIVTE
jgi:uncharacterized cupredoxin-like copper-binding protein